MFLYIYAILCVDFIDCFITCFCTCWKCRSKADGWFMAESLTVLQRFSSKTGILNCNSEEISPITEWLKLIAGLICQQQEKMRKKLFFNVCGSVALWKSIWRPSKQHICSSYVLYLVLQVLIHQIIHSRAQSLDESISTRVCMAYCELAVCPCQWWLKVRMSPSLKIPSIISEAKERIRQRSKQVEIFGNNAIHCLMSRRERKKERLEWRWMNGYSEV